MYKRQVFIIISCSILFFLFIVIISLWYNYTEKIDAYVSDLSKKEDYGAVIGVLSTIMDIGQTIGPILSGYVLIAFSFVGVFLMVSIVLCISALIFYII